MLYSNWSFLTKNLKIHIFLHKYIHIYIYVCILRTSFLFTWPHHLSQRENKVAKLILHCSSSPSSRFSMHAFLYFWLHYFISCFFSIMKRILIYFKLTRGKYERRAVYCFSHNNSTQVHRNMAHICLILFYIHS